METNSHLTEMEEKPFYSHTTFKTFLLNEALSIKNLQKSFT